MLAASIAPDEKSVPRDRLPRGSKQQLNATQSPKIQEQWDDFVIAIIPFHSVSRPLILRR